jgi:glutamine amidotransferase
MTNVCILDYGSGNVHSVLRAFQRLEIQTTVSNEAKEIKNASHLVLPGVGSFPNAIEKISTTLGTTKIISQLESGKPFLGICVGMQVLASTGFEFVETIGLNFFRDSQIKKIETSLSLPHVGWNSIIHEEIHPLLSKIPNGADFYFLHSFAFSNKLSRDHILADTIYGQKFPSVVGRNNVFGVQFHPEKSQLYGELLMKNFTNIK